jgi:hypothetical protein
MMNRFQTLLSISACAPTARHVLGRRHERRRDWQGLMDSARHVIGCHLTQETGVQNAFDDVASTIHQSLEAGVDCGGSCALCKPLDLTYGAW